MSPPEIFRILFVAGLCCLIAAEDFYELLGVTREADTREIRKAFKKLALTAHPDKNPDDAEAHENFLRINRAYEVLKDEDLRKKYDMYGEDGLKEDGPSGGGYKSWSFYKQDFGIYDDDAEIITLGKSDFEQSVRGTDDVWFINFYSPFCSHCHELAPTWREVAQQLEGVVRIGAVNCEDDHNLCRQEMINAYPSLFIYPAKERYNGAKRTQELIKWAVRFIPYPVVDLWQNNFRQEVNSAQHRSRPWFITFCGDGGDCLQRMSSTKLAAMLSNLVNVGEINCHTSSDLCETLGVSGGNYYYPAGKVQKGKETEFITLDTKELANEILRLQADLPMLDETQLKSVLSRVRQKRDPSWLIHFVEGSSYDLDLRKLPVLLSNIKVGRVDCRNARAMCNELHVVKLPAFIIFKQGGAHEIHHGRQTAHDVAAFAKESAQYPATVLGPQDFPGRVVEGNTPWFVDFYAPWCPPCMKLLPEFRKASKSVINRVSFGTVDCTIHSRLCEQYGVHSYPTTIFFNHTVPHQYHGHHVARYMLEFIEDIQHPSVITLTVTSFAERVAEKSASEMWLIDYYAPWCGPCNQLAPEWRRLARDLSKTHPNILVAQVNCDEHRLLCQQQGIHGYPAIMLYPMGTTDTSSAQSYRGWFRDAHNIKQWAMDNLPTPVKNLDQQMFVDILRGKEKWIIDFYAPWCGHCVQFAPEFKRVAEIYEGAVNAGKVNCDMQRQVCNSAGVRAYPTVKYYAGTSSGQQRAAGEEIPNLNGIDTFLKSRVRRKTARDEL